VVHLIVPFAAALSPAARTALASLPLPRLDTLLGAWAAVRHDAGNEDMLSLPHERALGNALGWTAGDGCLPWAAREAAAQGIELGDLPWGRLTPTHWRIGSDGVHLADPDALALSADDSRTLFAAVKPLFDSEGFRLAWGAPLRWYAAHSSLQDLATASIERAIGRNIDRWLPRQPAAKRLRRLQNEVQMVLHGHPLNETREATGSLPVNSFWLSGCGIPQPERTNDAQVDERLRAPALCGDWAAWREAWQALEQQALQSLLDAAARGEPVRLTLCGESSAIELAPRGRPWWQRMIESVSAAPPRARLLLESL
jgi:hypothetical protein